MKLKGRLLSLLLAVAMMITFMPGFVFADDQESVPSGEAAAEEQEAVEVVEAPLAEASSVEAPKAEAVEEPMADAAQSVQVAQTKLNYRDVTIKVEDLDAILAKATADSVKIEASMSYKKTLTLKRTITLALADFDPAEKSAEFGLPYFGKYKVVVTFMKKGKNVGTSITSTLGVAAEEYNIAALVATTDPLIFSLKYFIEGSVKKTTDSGDPVPTIATLNRPGQYDWSKLPEGIYRNPLLTAAQNTSKTMKWDNVGGPDNRIDRLVQYVKELNEINPGSKFNFYINDYHPYSFPRLSYANGLADDQYTLTLITDGSATYVWFKNAYEGVDDAQAVHDRLVSEYLEFKENARAGKVTDFDNLKSGRSVIYAYAMVEAENAQWWVVRKSTDTFGLTDAAFQAKVIGDARISNNYINNLLKSVHDNGTEDAFKDLYKFDDTAFNATRAKGKKIMMILGTSKVLEDTYPVTDYVRFMIAEMGDEYEFYYKGHPGNYTANSKENTAKYAAMGIQMLDPSIAAELFLFYNDDLYLCGYESSLFTNASSEKSEEQDIALFRRTLQTAKADPNLTAYADFMDCTINDLNDENDQFTYKYDEAWDAARPGIAEAKAEAIAVRDKIKDIVPEAEKKDGNYLVSYNNNGTKTVSEYDYAIWNSDKAMIHYVKTDEEGNFYIAASKYVGGPVVGDKVTRNSSTYKITSVRNKTVQLIKAKNSTAVSVPKTITIEGEKYAVVSIAAQAFKGSKIRTVSIGANVKKIAKYAFKGSKAEKIIVRSKLLTKANVKGSLIGSKVKYVKVDIGTYSDSKAYAKKYKSYFTKSNAGRSVRVYNGILLRRTSVSLKLKATYQQNLIREGGRRIPASQVSWKSSKPSVAKISKSGKITAVKAGTANMTATYKGTTYKFTVTVKK